MGPGAALGGAPAVLGGYDDSPGGTLLGFVLVMGALALDARSARRSEKYPRPRSLVSQRQLDYCRAASTRSKIRSLCGANALYWPANTVTTSRSLGITKSLWFPFPTPATTLWPDGKSPTHH